MPIVRLTMSIPSGFIQRTVQNTRPFSYFSFIHCRPCVPFFHSLDRYPQILCIFKGLFHRLVSDSRISHHQQHFTSLHNSNKTATKVGNFHTHTFIRTFTY